MASDAGGVPDPSEVPSEQQPEVVVHLERTLGAVAGLLALVPARGWARPTPCDGWDVRAVANHLATVTDKFTRFAAGEHGVVREDRRDWLGDDPGTGFSVVAAQSSQAWRGHPDALGRTCRLPFGDFDGATAAGINLLDAVVHGWDISTTTDQPWFPEPRAVELSLEVAELLVTPAARESGQFGPPGRAEPTPFGRLLASTGRGSAG